MVGPILSPREFDMLDRFQMLPILVLLALPLSAAAKPKGKTQVQLAVKPTSAQLFIDGKPMGKTGDNRVIDITAGPHVIRLVNKGDEHEERVNFAPSRKTIYTFEFDDVVPSNSTDPTPPPLPDDDLTRHRNEAGDDKP
jgi:hypothetical protein